MTDFLASGRAVDLILAVVALEAVLLSLWWRWRRQGVPPARLLPFLAAGAALLLALRGALTGADPRWLGLWLTLAGIAHLWDLRGRWRGRDGAGGL